MDASTSSPDSLVADFGALCASDPRACLLVDAAGRVISANPAARRTLPDVVPGTELAKLSPSPADVDDFIRQCCRTRGPLPGVIVLSPKGGEPVSWHCNGGLLERSCDGAAIVVLRLQPAETGKAAFAALDRKIEALNHELNRRDRVERDAAHLAAIVASSSDAIFSKTLDEVTTSWNLGAERMFGYSASEMIGQSGLSLIPLEKRAEEAKLMAQLSAGETPPPMETVRQARDGRLLDVSVTTSPIKNSSGAIIGVSKIVRDITARKRDEQSLRAAHATFTQLVENSPFGIYAVDADFRLVQVSKGAHKVFENVRPLIGRDFAEVMRTLWPESSATEFIGRFRHTLATGETYRETATIAARNDVEQIDSYDWQIERLVMPDGRFGVVCHFYDLSARHRLEAALRESEKRFRGTFENVSVGIAHVGVDGQWLEVNERLCEIAGLTREEILLQPLGAIVHPEDRKAAEEQMRRLIAGEIANYQIEHRYHRKDGSSVWIDDGVDLQRDEAGEPLYTIHVVRDISDRKAAQEHQQFLMRELSHRSKNQLAVVQAIAGQTARNAETIDEFSKTFGRRMNGLAVSVDLLVRGNWAGVPLPQLVRNQLETFKGDDGRLDCAGPNVTVNSDAAEAIGLALHELATNCVKHGAWSAAGTVSVDWAMESDGARKPGLRLSWVERGGPPVTEPTRRGFGQTVIEHMVAQKLDAEVDLVYAPEGLRWTLRVPGSRITR